MKHEPTITVECDGCNLEVVLPLEFDHHKPNQGWDDSNVDKEITSVKHEWTVINLDDDIHSCPDCIRKFND